jgi:lytic murein transglycosylase
MRNRKTGKTRAAALIGGALGIGLMATAAAAQSCQGAPFETWREALKQDAIAQGVSPRAAAALDSTRFDKSVVSRDRGQGVFSQTFLEFSDRMVSKYRLQTGAKLLKQNASALVRIEQQYGVPGPVIVAFWALETDFGANLGDFPTLTALATLAYDCRRPDFFREEVIAALKIIDEGDLTAAQMKGAWAGELGQMQFLPSDYLRNGVDFDGDGRRDLIRSVPDVLASSASLLKAHGWRAGEPWLQEVKVPAELPWHEADLGIMHPVSQWEALGVRAAHGELAQGMQASLLLPMGRTGPAFLAYPNFTVYTQWNKSLVYATTAAYLATRLAGAPPVSRGKPGGEGLSGKQMVELQKLLMSRGYDVGKPDGILGANTRAAVREMQVKLGLPADSYPTAELLRKLR